MLGNTAIAEIGTGLDTADLDIGLDIVQGIEDGLQEADIVDNFASLVFSTFRFVVVDTFRIFVAGCKEIDCAGCYKGLKVR